MESSSQPSDGDFEESLILPFPREATPFRNIVMADPMSLACRWRSVEFGRGTNSVVLKTTTLDFERRWYSIKGIFFFGEIIGSKVELKGLWTRQWWGKVYRHPPSPVAAARDAMGFFGKAPTPVRRKSDAPRGTINYVLKPDRPANCKIVQVGAMRLCVGVQAEESRWQSSCLLCLVQ